VIGVGRADHGKVGDGARHGEVFQRVVAGAVEAHRHAGVMADEADWHGRIGAIGLELLGTENGAEGGEGRGKGNVAARRHAGGDRDHVLLGDAEIEEPVGMALFEVVGAVGIGEIGGQHHDARVAVGDIGKLLAENEGGQSGIGRADD
jgi:hypothetical protein